MLSLAAVGSICILAGLAVAPEEPSPSAIGPHVRGATPSVKTLLATGAQRSPTFARLMRELDATDVVVYVESIGNLPVGLDGRLTFMTSAGGLRYLRVQVPNNLDVAALIAIAGHELQHALEIAAHPEVRDSTDLAVLYRRIGIQGNIPNHYDTSAARSIGRRVRAELG